MLWVGGGFFPVQLCELPAAMKHRPGAKPGQSLPRHHQELHVEVKFDVAGSGGQPVATGRVEMHPQRRGKASGWMQTLPPPQYPMQGGS